MKQIYLFFAVLFISTVSAQTFTAGGVNYSVISAANSTVGVVSSASYVGALVVPSTVTNASVNYTVTAILDVAFQNSTTLTSIVIPNTVTLISNGAFRGCTNLTSVVIPNSVTYIGQLAFGSCGSLTSVVIPNSVTFIGIAGFAYCSNLTSLTISNSLTSFSIGVFQGCFSLTSLTIPNSVTSLEQDAIRGCIGLTSIKIPSSVTNISNTVFRDCTALTSVTIPNSVTSIGTDVFTNCTNLNSVTVNWMTPFPISGNIFQNANIGNATLKVPVGTVALYQGAPVWKNFGTIAQPPAGTHLNFDGVNDNVKLASNISNTLSGGTAITIEYWFKGTNVQSAVRVQNTNNWIVAGWNLDQNPRFIISTDGGTNGVDIANPSEIQDNTWHHVACVWKKNEIFATYLDGVLKNSRVAANVNLPFFSDNDGFLGSLLGSSEFTNGNLDEVRIWNVARTVEQINGSKNCELQGNESGLLAYYKFNQGFDAADNSAITSITDATANANNGTLVNFTKTGTTSNFLAGSPIITGSTCATLNTSNFEATNHIKMYPNPTSNFVIVEVNNLTDANLQVIDITGKILIKKELNTSSNSIDVQQLSPGAYFFKVSSNESTSVSKMLKN